MKETEKKKAVKPKEAAEQTEKQNEKQTEVRQILPEQTLTGGEDLERAEIEQAARRKLAEMNLLEDFLFGSVVTFPEIGERFVKILLNFVINGTATAGVGEAANFVIGCALCVPAGIIYKKNHTRNGALIGMLTGTVIMTAAGCFINAYILLPAYGAAFGMPIEALVGMGTAVNAHITSLTTFVIFAVVPFNLLKGLLVSLIVFIIYKKIRPIFKMR